MKADFLFCVFTLSLLHWRAFNGPEFDDVRKLLCSPSPCDDDDLLLDLCPGLLPLFFFLPCISHHEVYTSYRAGRREFHRLFTMKYSHCARMSPMSFSKQYDKKMLFRPDWNTDTG